MDISDQLLRHKSLELPPFPVDDEFTEWVEDLIEVDSYYFGLASSYVSGYIQPISIEYFSDLKRRFARISPTEEDNEIYRISSEYLKSLESIVNFLKNV